MLVNLINICYCVMKNYKVVNWCKYTNADDVVVTTGMNNIGDKNTHKCAKIKPNQFRQYSS